MQRLGIDTPAKLKPYLDALHTDTERRPVAEQIIDRLLAEDESRYAVYTQIRSADQPLQVADFQYEPPADRSAQAIGLFISEWIKLERFLRQQAPEGERKPFIPTARAFNVLDISPADRSELERIRRLRNSLVHGIETTDAIDIDDATRRLKAISQRLNRRATT
jgi:hypothetical protein